MKTWLGAHRSLLLAGLVIGAGVLLSLVARQGFGIVPTAHAEPMIAALADATASPLARLLALPIRGFGALGVSPLLLADGVRAVLLALSVGLFGVSARRLGASSPAIALLLLVLAILPGGPQAFFGAGLYQAFALFLGTCVLAVLVHRGSVTARPLVIAGGAVAAVFGLGGTFWGGAAVGSAGAFAGLVCVGALPVLLVLLIGPLGPVRPWRRRTALVIGGLGAVVIAVFTIIDPLRNGGPETPENQPLVAMTQTAWLKVRDGGTISINDPVLAATMAARYPSVRVALETGRATVTAPQTGVMRVVAPGRASLLPPRGAQCSQPHDMHINFRFTRAGTYDAILLTCDPLTASAPDHAPTATAKNATNG